MRLKDFDHYFFYLLGLSILVIGIAWSPFLISLSQAILLVNWILEGNFRYKFKILFHRKAVLIFLSVFILHIIGIFYSTRIDAALMDIKIKLPLFIFPLVIGSTKTLSYSHLKIILHFFLATITISTILSVLALFGYTGYEIVDARDLSLFISHIRFGLLINIAIFSAVYLFFNYSGERMLLYKLLYGILFNWLIIFLFVLQSLTGIVVFMITSVILILRWSILKRNKLLRYSGIGVAIFIPIFIITAILFALNKYYSIEEVDINNLKLYTEKGNVYKHNTNLKQIENGNYVWLYVCEDELEEEWNKRSKLAYNGRDNKGHLIRYTIIRFLTSKGLKKDANGISNLSDEEIKYIENGYANHIYMNKLGFYPRIYQIIWEVDNYAKGQNPSGHSVTQRFEYNKSALHIIKNNLLIGVGTGDLRQAYDEYYKSSNSILTDKWRLRAHNQYLTFLVAFGIIGFTWIMFALLYSVFKEDGFKNYFFIMAFIISFLSMLNEDTLETQTGATFFAFFYSLFLFGYKTENQPDSFR